MQIIRIGDWDILPATNQVQNHRSSFFLKPRLMRLLVFLLEHPNRIVTKVDLMEAVWEGRIVTDNLLTKSISELRQTIDEYFPDLMEIETIRSVGYEFRCQSKVEFLEEGRNEQASQLLEEKKVEKKLTGPMSKIGAGVIFFLFLAFIFWKNFSEKPTATAAPYRVVFSPVTSATGQERHAAISPEGANLVYAWRKDQGEPFYLYTRHLDSAWPRRLTSQEGRFEFNPFWSADGQKIAFMRLKEHHYDLFMAPLAGGEEEWLAKFDFYRVRPKILWMAGQNQIIFSAKKTAEAPSSIYTFNLGSKQFDQLTFPPDSLYGDHFPSLLPDGRLAFARSAFGKSLLNPKAPGKGEIILMDLENGKQQSLAYFEGEILGMDYSKPLKKIFVWLAKQLEYELEAYGLDGQVEKVTDGGSYRPDNLTAHPTEPYLLYEAWASQMNIHILEEGNLMPFLHSTHWDWHPRISADGRKIAFVSARNGAIQIWMAAKDKPDQVTPISDLDCKSLFWLSLSPDAETVLLQGKINGEEGIYVLDVKSKKTSAFKKEKYAYAHPEFSPDGQHIFYASDQSGSWQIWRCNLAGGEEEMITKKGGYKAQPVSDSSGNFLYFSRFDDDGLWKMDLNTRLSENIFPADEMVDKMNCVATDKGIYYFSWIHGQCFLKFFDFKQNASSEIRVIAGVVPEIPSLGIGNNGTILISKSDNITADLLKVEIGK
ncbi:MAG: PD40 domain-containing protein [Phaeodactylibacter sp.]|nr:PD40 domain-containing protein [Phaeodactylibacter sp.]